jgi:hypothetical protein
MLIKDLGERIPYTMLVGMLISPAIVELVWSFLKKLILGTEYLGMYIYKHTLNQCQYIIKKPEHPCLLQYYSP